MGMLQAAALLALAGFALADVCQSAARIYRPSQVDYKMRHGAQVRVTGVLGAERHRGVHIANDPGSWGGLPVVTLTQEALAKLKLKGRPTMDTNYSRFLEACEATSFTTAGGENSSVYHVDVTGLVIKNTPPVDVLRRSLIEFFPMIVHEVRVVKR